MRITAPEEQFTRVGVQILDRKDGSFMVRYRMYASYKNLKIEVQANDKHMDKSPYFLKGKNVVSCNNIILELSNFQNSNCQCYTQLVKNE